MLESTGCTASCGIGNSVLIARLATRRAKPNGVYCVLDGDIPEFIRKVFVLFQSPHLFKFKVDLIIEMRIMVLSKKEGRVNKLSAPETIGFPVITPLL